MPLTSLVAAYIARHKLFDSADRILVAVSGGPDSLALFLLLNELGYPITVAHFDHRLRTDSGKDAEFVKRLAEERGLPWTIGSEDVHAYAQQHRKSIEEAARILRYQFLGREALARHIHSVVVGHTADDQAETVLMHLIRGTGPSGMRGMLPSTDLGTWLEGFPAGLIRIVRPLLQIRRTQTESYCREQNISPIYDPSNTQSTFRRNRLRNELIPQLEKYNPQVVSVINRLAGIVQTQVDFVDRAAEDFWEKNVHMDSDNQIRIPKSAFKNTHRAIQQVLIRKVFLTFQPTLRDIAHSHTDQAISFFYIPTLTSHLNLSHSLQMAYVGEEVLFYLEKPTSPILWENTELAIPGSMIVDPPNWKITLVRQEGRPLKNVFQETDGYRASLDFDLMTLPLTVRTRKSGDTFDPIGLHHTIKLSEFMSTQHIPKQYRRTWPMICDGRGIVWVPGYRVGERVKLSNRTTRWIDIKIQPASDMVSETKMEPGSEKRSS
jgi:tRNA(Ile)-lysidine synthase